MSLSSQQHADLADDAYNNRKIGVRKPDAEELEVINGTTYRILEHYRNPRNGYAGTVYQRTDTGDIEVAHRGTEVKNIPGLVMDLAYTDGSMVLRKVTPHAQDAMRAVNGRALIIKYFIANLPRYEPHRGMLMPRYAYAIPLRGTCC